MEDLYTKILDYVTNAKQNTYQFKPEQHQIDINQKLTRMNIDAQLQTIKKDNSNKIDHQIYNICQNIVFTFFSLDNQKFYAVLQRSKYWGLDLCLQEFILEYYLYIKSNNRLRQFIMLHFNKIILTTKSIIQAQLIEKINLQHFDSTEKDIHNLQHNLEKKEEQLAKVSPSEVKQQITAPIKNQDDAAKLKQQILADLKAKNKTLEQI